MSTPSARLALRLSIVLTLVFGVHYFFWARLVRDTALSSGLALAATLTLCALGVSLPASLVLTRTLPRRLASPLGWLAFVWMGAMFFLWVLLLVGELVRLALWARGLVTTPLSFDQQLFAQRLLGGGALAGAALLALSGVLSVRRGPVLERVRVELPKWPAALAGFRVVQLSDVHVSSTLGKDFIEALVERVNALDADLVVLTGDLVDGTVPELREHIAPLGKLRARHGVFAVTGNHEYYSGADAWIAEFTRLGMRVLRNEAVIIEQGGARFELAGIDDASAHQFGGDHGADVERALSSRDPSLAVVLLAHQPRQVLGAAALGVDLQLSGHTHGGQLYPMHYLVKLQQPYVAGLYKHGATALYVSRGTAYWGPPMRVGARAEITELSLHPAQ